MEPVSIIIPAYNEQGGIGDVLDGIIETMKESGIEHEVIVVDDGSTDGTAEIARMRGVRVICHPYNKGYGAALKTGIRAANGEVIVTMDSDGQHDPEDIPRLVKYIGEHDMVVGTRMKNSYSSWMRKLGRIILSLVANYLAEMKIPDLNCGFRAIKQDAAMRFMHILPNGFSFSTTITLAMIKEGYNVKYVPITSLRRVGKSSLNLVTDGAGVILLIVRTITLFNPLRVFFPISWFLFVLGLGYLAYALIVDTNVPDASVLLILSGILLFFFGILADQISSIRREMMG